MNPLRIAVLVAVAVAMAACASPSNSVMQMAQEKSACAELGLDPGSNAFAQCVGNLDATMFEAGPGHQR